MRHGRTRTFLLAAMALAAGCGSHSPITPLIVAAREGATGEIARQVRCGADPNQRGGVNEWTPLMHAIHKNQLASVKSLLEAGADINAGSREGETPLMMAAGYGETTTVALLLAAGADPRVKDNDDKTALDYAVAGVPDIDKITITRCQTSTVQALLDKAPDLELVDGGFGKGAHLMAKAKGCAAILALLDRRK